MEDKILCDRNDLVFTDTYHGGKQNYDLPASRITLIKFETKPVKSFLGIFKKNTRVISITANGISRTLELYEFKETEFVKYIDMLRDFAKKNNIKLEDSFGE